MSRPATQNTLREQAAGLFQAGIDAADPYLAVRRSLSSDGLRLEIALSLNDNAPKRTGYWPKIHVIAFGKAACNMAKAARDIIPESLLTGDCIIVTNYENAARIPGFKVIGAGHPIPDEAGLQGARLIADRITNAQSGELALVLISGGGSALLPYPRPPITLEEKAQTTSLLLACGATINQVNCVRKHLSMIKGGGLARLSAPANLHALILSDVLGDDLSAIASGPTVPDDTGFDDAIAILREKGLWESIPDSVKYVLQQGTAGNIPETPKTGDELFNNTDHTLIGSNPISLKAVVKAASQLDYDVRVYSEHLSGEAKDEAFKLASYAKSLLDSGLNNPIALLAGGETTVTLTGQGLGGRNQEMG
ncbi:MAG: glycerate kinase, partial [Methylomicrobium sp.]|nr:glycerate kinase [Methylomicrobium sp.]